MDRPPVAMEVQELERLLEELAAAKELLARVRTVAQAFVDSTARTEGGPKERAALEAALGVVGHVVCGRP